MDQRDCTVSQNLTRAEHSPPESISQGQQQSGDMTTEKGWGFPKLENHSLVPPTCLLLVTQGVRSVRTLRRMGTEQEVWCAIWIRENGSEHRDNGNSNSSVVKESETKRFSTSPEPRHSRGELKGSQDICDRS